MGLFLFAAHTTVLGVLLYHIPKYLFLELPGEKKPSSKLWPEETKVSPLLIDWSILMESPAIQKSKGNEKQIQTQKKAKKNGSPLMIAIGERKTSIYPEDKIAIFYFARLQSKRFKGLRVSVGRTVSTRCQVISPIPLENNLLK